MPATKKKTGPEGNMERIREKYVALYDFAPVGYLTVEKGGKILELNLTASVLLGLPRSRIEGKPFQAFLAGKSPGTFEEFSREVLWSGEKQGCEVSVNRDGEGVRYLRLEGAPFQGDDGEGLIQLALMDITEQKRAGDAVLASLREKEVLLREIHHRVKNNLQLISGLLDMTRSRTEDPQTRDILSDVMLKIQTMAQIHTKVYESSQIDRVDLGSQIRDQVRALSQLYADTTRRVETVVDSSEVTLPIDQAVPLALVVNEILSNAYKHAFAGRREGKVEVSITRRKARIRLTIRDDGVGMPPGFDLERSDTLGLKLVRALVTQQLRGTLEFRGHRGTEVIVELPVKGEEEHV
jgi:PAS domain S-box-containing protein